MKWRAVFPALAALLFAVTASSSAQQQAPLTLEEAIDLAKRTSPNYLQTLNDLAPAGWNVRSANANLFLPSADINFFAAWQDAGEQRLGASTFLEPSVLLSQYQVNLRYQLNGNTLFSPGQRKAEQNAVHGRVENAALDLSTRVTSAYVEVLRLDARAEQAERELRRSHEHLRLAEARQEVGAGTRLETMQAEVARGRAEVDLLVARNAARVAKLRLVEALGVQLPSDQIELVSSFEVFQPQYDIEGLITDALARHPRLVAMKADRSAANASVKVAKAAYFPALSLTASWSGFAREETDPNITISQSVSSAQQQAQGCNEVQQLFGAVGLQPPLCKSAFTTQDSIDLDNQFREINNQFPFAFRNEPVSVSAFVSIPIFSNFDRQVQVEQSIAAKNDIEHQLRAQELRIRADVAEAVYNLETAYEAVMLQRENTERAREELRLARERYQLGAGTFLELLDSETLGAQAEVDEIEAGFAFHQNLTALEAAVGRPMAVTPGDSQSE